MMVERCDPFGQEKKKDVNDGLQVVGHYMLMLSLNYYLTLMKGSQIVAKISEEN